MNEKGILAIAEAINNLARAIDRLGTNQAATPMGAIEALALEVKEGFSLLASAISDLKPD
jgi:hypothetical protein